MLPAAGMLGVLASRSRANKAFRAALAASAEAEAIKEGRLGRQVKVDVELNETMTLSSASVESLDAFMKENAAEVCVQAEKVEPAINYGEQYCWLTPIRIGPLCLRMRLTVAVDVAESSQVDVKILQMEPGLLNQRTGELRFNPSLRPDFQVTNRLTWKQQGASDLHVTTYSRNAIAALVPWWLPLPDVVIERTIGFFITQVVKATIKKTETELAKRYWAWMSE